MHSTNVMREHTSRSLISLISPDQFDPMDRAGSQKTYRVPEHQRYPSWSSLKKERLVDSVMANWIIGQITLTKHNDPTQNGDEYFNVQDGQTRMGALQEFVMDKFPWNGRLYSELTAEERARFNAYTVQLDIFKKERNMSQADFNRIICEIFERLNSGTPLTDNDKYWNRSDTPAMQLLNRLKGSAEFGPQIHVAQCGRRKRAQRVEPPYGAHSWIGESADRVHFNFVHAERAHPDGDPGG